MIKLQNQVVFGDDFFAHGFYARQEILDALVKNMPGSILNL